MRRPEPEKSTMAWMRGKVANVVQHCIYEIATGRWPEGALMPSVREAESQWGVNRLTVLKAYRRLAELGLVRSVDRSGFYVSGGEGHASLSSSRHEMERFYDSVARRVRSETGFSPLGVFRYLAQMAEIRAREQPEHCFVECTRIQAEGHAREITQRLGVPLLAMTIDEIAGKRSRIASHVRTVLTSHWHDADTRPLHDPPRLRVASIPIEVAPELARGLDRAGREAVVLDTRESDALHVARDVRELGGGGKVVAQVVPDVPAALAKMFPTRGQKSAGKRIALLSPRFWGMVTPKWRKHPAVLPIRFRIAEAGWPQVAEALGMPLGVYEATARAAAL